MADYRAPIDSLAAALRPLHKALLDHEAERYGLEPGSWQLLDLAAGHLGLAWLRHLSQVMADLDARRSTAAAPIAAVDAAACRRAIETLIGPAPAAVPEFRRRYLDSLQDSVAAAAAHAALRAVLRQLPAMEPA